MKWIQIMTEITLAAIALLATTIYIGRWLGLPPP